MAWSAVVRRDAPSLSESTPSPLPRLLDTTSSREGSIAIAVVDANALISSPCSARLLGLADRFVSVKEVLDEVRDPASRFQLASLPFTVDCIEPTDDALRSVVQFARETGDLQSLSEVDLKLLALTYMLEEQAHGSAHLRTRPPPLHVTQVRHVHERDLPGWGTNVQNLEEWEELPQEPDDAVDQDSHILGLKKLSLNAAEAENGITEEENKRDFQEAISMVPKEEVRNAVEGLSGQTEEHPMHSMHVELHLDNLSRGHRSDEEKLKEGDPNLEEEVSQEGGDWQRAISRSTKRKHDKRAARAATKKLPLSGQDVESEEGDERSRPIVQYHNTAELSTITFCGDENRLCQDNEQCQSCVSYEGDNAGVTVHDENNGAEELQDEFKVNGCCSTYVESQCGEEEPASTYGTESEDSWMLRPLSNSNVACITADFPMQNVLLQIGLRVISPNGLQVQQLHRWVLKCEACRNVTSDVGRLFCPKCGNGGTLYKVSVTIGPNGVVHTGTRRRSNLRGTKYSLPMPKSGRRGVMENPILREDQLPQKMLHPRKKKVSLPDVSTSTEFFALKSGGKGKMQPPICEALAVFSGKRNPNDCRSKHRGK